MGGLWVSGGNCFVLRQAMYLSGLDEMILEKVPDLSFFYGGHSAGVCVLSKTLVPLKWADDPNNFPYKERSTPLRQGLNIFEESFMPHFQSNHPESEAIKKCIEYCQINALPYKTIPDGEVFITSITK